MPRFNKNSFKSTPLKLTCESSKIENLTSIIKLVNERRFKPDDIPSTGWIPFQNESDVDYQKEFEVWKLPNELEVLPCTGFKHLLIPELKRYLSLKVYAELPLAAKYKQLPIDFVFFKNNNSLFALISAINDNSVKFAIEDYLRQYPFSDYGFVIEKHPPPFLFPNDLILWLLYRYFKKEKTVSTTCKLIDIRHLDESLVGIPNTINLDGDGTADNVPELKYGINQRRTFEKIEILCTFNRVIYEFLLHSNGNAEFKFTENIGILDDNVDSLSKRLFVLTELYSKIIPAIKEAYTQDYPNWEKIRDDFRKEMGEIAKKHIK